MKNHFTYCAILFFLLLLSCGRKSERSTEKVEEKPIELKLNLEEDRNCLLNMKVITKLETLEGEPVSSTTTTEYQFDYSLKNDGDFGHIIILATIKSVKTTGTLLDSLYSYDSKTQESSGEMGAEVAKSMKKLIGTTSETELDSLARIIRRKTLVKSNCMVLNYMVFPDHPVKLGDEWTGEIKERTDGFFNLMSLKYKLMRVTDTLAEIRFNGSFFFDAEDVDNMGNQNGTIKVNRKTGLCQNIFVEQAGSSSVISNGYQVSFSLNNEIYITLSQ